MMTLEWSRLSVAEQQEILRRPVQKRQPEIIAEVTRIIEQIRADGDASLRALTRRLDGVELDVLQVNAEEFAAARKSLPEDLKGAIAAAYERIWAFHQALLPETVRLETAPGVICERITRPITAVGMYIPAGSAPLPSTVLMLGIPAQIAGCAKVVLCSPVQANGGVDATVLYAAECCGIDTVFKLGGAQAIAAMAYGTDSVPRCDKIFGPGNAWVTAAKLAVAADPDGAAIDMPAGPSEVLIIADSTCHPEFVAADLLSQAEHGADSQVMLIATSQIIIEQVKSALKRQISSLPRAEVAGKAIKNSCAILVDDIPAAIAISNRYAPEHLILATADARSWLSLVSCAGSIFLGHNAPEAVGDYCSGTNHVLPTCGAARAYSGVSVQSFLNFITVQELSRQGLETIGPCAIRLAEAEGLHAHARAVAFRLNAPL